VCVVGCTPGRWSHARALTAGHATPASHEPTKLTLVAGRLCQHRLNTNAPLLSRHVPPAVIAATIQHTTSPDTAATARVSPSTLPGSLTLDPDLERRPDTTTRDTT
jgi:hypothetical protein